MYIATPRYFQSDPGRCRWGWGVWGRCCGCGCCCCVAMLTRQDPIQQTFDAGDVADIVQDCADRCQHGREERKQVPPFESQCACKRIPPKCDKWKEVEEEATFHSPPRCCCLLETSLEEEARKMETPLYCRHDHCADGVTTSLIVLLLGAHRGLTSSRNSLLQHRAGLA